jgi:phasin family protein
MFNNNNQFFNFETPNYSEAMQKNLDAMMKANQVSIENGQAIARRVGEIFQRNIGEAVEATREILSSQNPETAMQKQQDYIKNVTSEVVANSKEVVEMASKSVMEVYDIYSKSFSDNAAAVAQNTVKKPAK